MKAKTKIGISLLGICLLLSLGLFFSKWQCHTALETLKDHHGSRTNYEWVKFEPANSLFHSDEMQFKSSMVYLDFLIIPTAFVFGVVGLILTARRRQLESGICVFTTLAILSVLIGQHAFFAESAETIRWIVE